MPPDVRWLLSVEEEIRLGRVGVAIALAREEPERDQRVEKVPRRSRMKPEPHAERLERLGPCASSVKTPISIALRSVFDGQNARPVCRIFSGFGGCMGGVRCALRWQENARISACGSQEVKLDLEWQRIRAW